MGSLCCGGSPSYGDVPSRSSSSVNQPDEDVRRQQILAAAMKRQANQEKRGIQDVEAYRSKMKMREKYSDQGNSQYGGGGLKWNVG